jgi:hypothetical protein
MENVATPIAVPNGTDITSPLVLDYVSRYRGFIRKTAESILGLAQTLIEAESDLDEVEFAIFLDEINVERGSSTYSKLKKIGETLSRFSPFLEKLPNTWTTLYELSKMNPPEFDRVASKLNPFITVKEIQHLLGRENGRDSRKVDLSLTVGELDPVQKSELYEEIKKLKDRFGFAFSTSQTLIDELKSLKTQKAA